MSDSALPPGRGIPPLDVPEQLILQRVRNNPASKTARILSAALKLSIKEINPEAPGESIGPGDIIQRYGPRLDLQTLNDYKVILSKTEGCQVLAALGVRKLQDRPKFLNRYISRESYESVFGRRVSTIKGRGQNKLLFTYGEIVYLYTVYLRNLVPETLPDLPETLRAYAEDADSSLEE